MNNIKIPVSIGELFDKITILEIKKDKIKDKSKLANIKNELIVLNLIALKVDSSLIEPHIKDLKSINAELWDIEESKRNKEKLKLFDSEFIQLARNVYIKNDKRAEIKKLINLATNSYIVEEKSYD